MKSGVTHKNRFDFTFLVHPRNIDDIYKKYPFLRFVNKKLLEHLLIFSGPIFGGRIVGLKDKKGDEIRGGIMVVPLTGRMMLRDKKNALNKVIQAVKKSRSYGAKIVGLGAFTSSVSNGGVDVSHIDGLIVTSGNSLTSYRTFKDIENILLKNPSISSVAIVGATGSIGRAVSILIVKNNLTKEVLFVGKTEQKLIDLSNESKGHNQGMYIRYTTNVRDIMGIGLIVVATSAHDALLHNDFVSPGSIIYDLTQPKNTSREVQSRADITYYDGGLIRLPEHISIKVDLGLPESAVFSCLAETMILASSDVMYEGPKAKLDIDHILRIGRVADDLGFVSFLKA